tara:strand:+ start:948 stop:1421 length:474 start_codon:yes stop_codon:yes gene_type:complete
MRLNRQPHPDRIADRHCPASDHHAHDPGFADHRTVGRPIEHCGKQSLFECLDLPARVPQTSDFQHRAGPDFEEGALGQGKQVDPPGGDVLSQVAGVHAETSGRKLLQQFAMDQVDLTQVRLGGIGPHAREVLDTLASMSIAPDAPPSFELDPLDRLF